MKQPRFLVLEEVLRIHAHQIEQYGGSFGVRDAGLLLSAVAAPQASFAGGFLHGTPFEMAAAYLFHLARNHPFLDGNKRTALARSEEHTSELQSPCNLVCRLLLEKKNTNA